MSNPLSPSLSSTFLRNRIIGALRCSSNPLALKAALEINQNVVFSHPTIKQLSAHLAQLVSGVDAAPTSSIAAIEQMIAKYSAGLLPITRLASTSSPIIVLLTGSTGGLGSFLLEGLLKDSRVSKIYAYNRPSKSATTLQDRQRDAFIDKGFDPKLLKSEKLVYMEGDAALPLLGLTSKSYDEV